MKTPSASTEASPVVEDAPQPPAPPSLEAPTAPRRGLPLFGKRRRFLVHRPSQLRVALIVTGLALVFLVLLNFSLHSARLQAMTAVAAEAPALLPMLQEQGRLELWLGIGASLVCLVGIFCVTILETHRTAGAAFHLSRELRCVRDGGYGRTVRLRKGDNLRDIETAFNEMTHALAERANLDVMELEHAASVAERVANPPEARELANTLLEMAATRRRYTLDGSS